ncbi:MAG TPA: SPOR domain-containing protein, partial [Rhodanobacteraceae bacterium]|nr:SPOR domain-containing protein [Rhodanobacteraceae bacterium]
MDLSLKQRLLGAVVLIALAIIFVPMFLSRPAPQQSSETVNLAIPPAPDREFQNRVLPVDSAQDAAKNAQPVSSQPLATVDTPPRPPEIAQPTAPVPVTPAPEAAKPVTSAPTPAAEAPKPAPSEPGRAANGHFYVHLGIYAETKNADDLVGVLKQGGFPAFAEASDYQGKPAERVRVGP